MAAGPRRGQTGQSLVEVIVAILLLASALIGVLGGLFTVQRVTEVNEQEGRVNAALVTYGEIIRTSVTYRPCTTTTKDEYKGYDGADPDSTGPLTAPKGARSFHTVPAGFTGTWAGAAAGPGIWSVPSNVAVDVTAVDSWDQPNQGFATGCVTPDSGVQRVTVQVRAFDPNNPSREIATKTAQVVKRREGPS